jgi:hypothetical protein
MERQWKDNGKTMERQKNLRGTKNPYKNFFACDFGGWRLRGVYIGEPF